MKKMTLFMLAVVVTLPLLLGGCGKQHRYLVVTEDYTTYVTTNKPEIGSDGGTIMFKDEKGRDVALPHGSIKEMRKLE